MKFNIPKLNIFFLQLWEWMKEREWYQPSAEVHMKLISHLSSPLSKASQCTRVYDSLLVHDLKASSGTFTQVVMRLIEEEELILAWRVCQDMEAFGGFAIPISILHLLLEVMTFLCCIAFNISITFS